ncbi:uncharacterized protein LOC132181493 isoform X2 [Corylus avellana]|uniref:uncharacterized protein LOC132181493 isoform X2 n=1 Tax=Corylus avellana TaxID=13451 RepID=UPI00286C32D3|nr:uncharacterized protein LOC132181493 isoform X2 [Corylus avellana]
MIVLQCGPVYPTPSKLSVQLSQPLTSFLSLSALLCSSKSKSKLSSKASFKCSCTPNEDTHEASYQVLSLLVVQTLEFIATLSLLRWTAKPKYEFVNFFKANNLSKERNWLLASILGFGFLFLLVFLTSILADRLIGSKAVNNPILKEILLSNDISKAACVLLYCIVTPVLEETVYRGFLLTSMLPTMKWQQAIFISSVIFSAAHFSAENFLQLVIIGCVLGSSYCWTGNLSSSIVIHSLYNAMTLILTLLS